MRSAFSGSVISSRVSVRRIDFKGDFTVGIVWVVFVSSLIRLWIGFAGFTPLSLNTGLACQLWFSATEGELSPFNGKQQQRFGVTGSKGDQRAQISCEQLAKVKSGRICCGHRPASPQCHKAPPNQHQPSFNKPLT